MTVSVSIEEQTDFCECFESFRAADARLVLYSQAINNNILQLSQPRSYTIWAYDSVWLFAPDRMLKSGLQLTVTSGHLRRAGCETQDFLRAGHNWRSLTS